jgi:hypothetical protein
MTKKQKQYHFIYKTTNLLNNRYYIGLHSTNNLKDGYLGSGTYLRRSLNKHGRENHQLEILEFCKTREELKSREIEIVNLNEIAKKECMNLRTGGVGGFINKEHQYKCQSAGGNATAGKNIIRMHEMRTLYPEYSEYISRKISENLIEHFKTHDGTFKGKTHSTETKQKMSESSKGIGIGCTNSQYGTCWITNETINKKIYKSDEIPNGFRTGRIT